MLINKIKKITGVLKVRILIPDFEKKTFEEDNIYLGGICLDIQGNKSIYTHYIPGVLDANFITYKEFAVQSKSSKITQDILEHFNWESSHKLNISNVSKQWDYISFKLDDLDICKVDLISFSKINKIAGIFSLEKKYSIYGSVNHYIDIHETIKTNLIHDSLAKQIFYSSDQNKSYSGALVYTICEKDGIFFLEILGFTSNDFYGNSRIVPIRYCENIDCFLSTATIPYTPSLNNLTEIPIVKSTIYPQFTKNFSTYIKKDDIVISVNQMNILEMQIYSFDFNQKLSLDEYFTYLLLTRSKCFLVLIRKGKIIEILIDIQIFRLELPNPIYMDINNLYVNKKSCLDIQDGTEKQCKGYLNLFEDNEIKFSTDICDAMLEFNIFNKQIVKYMNDITYSIEKISI
jgi:hypothetical protein